MLRSIHSWPTFVTDLTEINREKVAKDTHPYLASEFATRKAATYGPSLEDLECVLRDNGWLLGGPFEGESINGFRFDLAFVAANRENGRAVVVAYADPIAPPHFYTCRVNRDYAARLEFVPSS